MLPALLKDVRYAARALARRPGFTVVALLTLALGIGANAAVFSAVYGILLRPFPFPDSERLVSLNAEQFVSTAEVLYLREHARSLGGVGAISPGWGIALTGSGDATQLMGSRVSANMLEVLGARPMLGRGFHPDEERPGRGDVAILGHALWVERFGSDRSVVGRRITLDGDPVTIVGVLPPGFEVLGRPADLWMPLTVDPSAWHHRGAASWLIARLSPGATVDQARAEFLSLAPRMREAFEYPAAHYRDATVLPLHERAVGGLRRSLLVVMAAVGFIVLIAGANVGNLLLMRAAGRRQEIAVRTALGASRARLIRQMLIESVVLALAGAALGVALGAIGVGLLRGALPADTPRLSAIALDGTVLGVCVLVALVTGVAFGLTPAFLASSGDVQGTLRGARSLAGRAGGERARGVLVVAEVALALVLVIGAGLMMRTLWALTHVDAGLRPSGVLTLRLQPTSGRYPGADRQLAYFDEVIERMRRLPGVTAAGAIHHVPLGGFAWYANVELEGRPLSPGEAPMRSGWRVIAGDYFQTMGIPLLRGRAFGPGDTGEALPVVIVNDAFARAAWPLEDPIGKRLAAGNATRGTVVTVVGVVGAVRHVGLDAPPGPELYRPQAQTPMAAMTIVVRTASPPSSMAGPARRAVVAIDADVPISDVRPLEEVIARSVARPRLIMTLLLVFAGLGVVLGAIGIYGVIAFAVGERRREIGVRIALGAEPSAVAGMVLRRGLGYAAAGVAVGLVGALGLTRMMRSLVFGVSTTDPAVFVGLSLLLLAVAAAASYLPARQAARLDPATVLRNE